MEKCAFINAKKLPVITKDLHGSEIKMLLLVLCYLSSSNQRFVINNKEWREHMASVNFKLTPERTSSIFSSLAKKGILKREVKGVYSVVDDLYIPAKVGQRVAK